MKLTPTQTRMWNLLADGNAHYKSEMIACLDDPECSGMGAVREVVCQLRKVLRPMGQDIVVVTNGRSNLYRRIRVYTAGE